MKDLNLRRALLFHLGVIAVLLVALCTFASHLIIEKSQKARAAGR